MSNLNNESDLVKEKVIRTIAIRTSNQNVVRIANELCEEIDASYENETDLLNSGSVDGFVRQAIAIKAKHLQRKLDGMFSWCMSAATVKAMTEFVKIAKAV